MSESTRRSPASQTVQEAMAQHDGLVHAFIRHQGGGAIAYEEALQAGRIGLWQAIQKYDPARGNRFSTYAWVAICRHIHRRADELRRETEVWRPEMATPITPWITLELAEGVDQERTGRVLRDLVDQLPQRLRQVIVGRYGLGEGPPRTLKDLGQEMGLSGERVRQLQQEALAWLRHPAHSWRLRQVVGKDTTADYRRALAQNAVWQRSRRQSS